MTRGEAIKKIYDASFIGNDGLDYVETRVAIDTIQELSTPEIPNKCGRWILGVNDNTCSICGEHSLTHWQSKFCPNCGVTMEGGVSKC